MLYNDGKLIIADGKDKMKECSDKYCTTSVYDSHSRPVCGRGFEI